MTGFVSPTTRSGAGRWASRSASDGALYVSEDANNAIYCVSYRG